MSRSILVSLVLVLGTVEGNAAESPTKADLHFEQSIRPVLVTKCLKCHGEKKQEGHLRLDSR
ncbi:MAG: hypothetical protein KDA84_10395, partial [Planctomycetaceae bacterium]|nr:hypothetical protein [Planctomycetaceae bacterium]